MTTTNNIKQFEIGKQYSMRSACDYDCVWTYTVINRTACTITLKSTRGEQITCRINKKITAWSNAETVLPLGNYSMAPMLKAK
jgi:hypothetical protein